jgi:hypothetical protein
MPTEKIASPPPPLCRSEDHYSPSMRVFESGTYRHTCSACGHVTVFTVDRGHVTVFILLLEEVR